MYYLVLNLIIFIAQAPNKPPEILGEWKGFESFETIEECEKRKASLAGGLIDWGFDEREFNTTAGVIGIDTGLRCIKK